MNKKAFTTEYEANLYARKVNGTVRISWLPPDYNSTITKTIWIVEWK